MAMVEDMGTIFTFKAHGKTLRELKEFINKAEDFVDDDNMSIRVIDKELRLRWPAEDKENGDGTK